MKYFDRRKMIQNLISTTAFLVLLVSCSSEAAGKQVKVLFIGNSYTYVNNLPVLIADMATASGDQLVFSTSAPGGHTLEQHASNPATLSLIAQGGWDYVVLQEQSQRPAFPDAQVVADVYPYARKLDSLVKAADSCTKTVFYMTWGRKNGDQMNCAFFPPLCTYLGMDSLLQLRYSIMADNNGAVLAPVAKVWRQVRAQHPSLELYDADESHPSLKGSFAAAAAFYAIFFNKNPALNSYTAGLDASEALTIKNAAKLVVFDSLTTWYQHDPLPAAQFNYTVSGNQVSFQNASTDATTFKWYFGDGDSSTLEHPVHSYASIGTYPVTLIASHCSFTDTTLINVQMSGTGLEVIHSPMDINIYPNPAKDFVSLQASEDIRKVVMFSVSGSKVAEWQSLKARELELDIRLLSSGMYYLNMITDEGRNVRLIQVIK